MRQKACLVLAIWLCPLPAAAQKIPVERQFERQMQQRVSVTWQRQELGQALERLSVTQQISVWLDRRVDPQQLVDLQFSDMPLYQGIEKLATQHQLGVSQLGPVIYVGPRQSAQELDALSQQARRMLAHVPTSQRRRWLEAEACGWPRLGEPRRILVEWFTSAKISLHGDESIPHDLWRARHWPPLSLVDRVVLVLVGFDLTCQISRDGKSCEVVPIRRPLVMDGRKLSLVPVPTPRRNRSGQQAFTLKLQNQPVGRVLDQIAKQLNLEVVWDKELLAARPMVREFLVSCDLQNVDSDKLLESILQPADLRCWSEGNRLKIEASRVK